MRGHLQHRLPSAFLGRLARSDGACTLPGCLMSPLETALPQQPRVYRRFRLIWIELMKALLFIALTMPVLGQQYRAFWADAFHKGYKDPAQIDQMVEDVATAKCNAILMEVRNRGGSYFLKSIEPPVEDSDWSPSFDALQYLIEKAHARGIEVHAWYPVTPLWPLARAPLDPAHAWNLHGPQTSGDAMWMTLTAGGKVSSSVDPGHPDVARYLANVILDPVRNYDLDGIHLDYIRYPEDDDYGYNPKAVERFQRLQSSTFSQFRRDQVTALVRQIYLRAAELKPSLKVSAALITWGDGPATDAQFRTKDAYSRVFQDWRSWMEEGILDVGMPMNYFRQTQNASFLQNWVDFEKSRQYKRTLAIGVANYLNTIEDSVTQLRKVQASGVSGITFYSYASTNTLDNSGLPIIPNSEFYRTIGESFGDAAGPPALPWKTKPSTGHVLGTLKVEGGPAWLNDGVEVSIESDTGRGFAAKTQTDGTGFFGAVDLAPDRYRVRLARGGIEIFRTSARDVLAGSAIRFDALLKAEDFAGVVPRIAASAEEAAPGEVITLTGANLDKPQVLVNGALAVVSAASAAKIEVAIPFNMATAYNVKVRRAGMESETVTLRSVAVRATIQGVRRVAGRYLEIYAIGLGMLNGQTLAAPVSASLGTAALKVLYAGLMPGQQFRYQINIELPDNMTTGAVDLRIGDQTVSIPAP